MTGPRGNWREQIPEARWETVHGGTERLDADTIKITVGGRTAAPRSALFGATVVVDDRVPHDYQRKMRRLVGYLEGRWIV